MKLQYAVVLMVMVGIFGGCASNKNQKNEEVQEVMVDTEAPAPQKPIAVGSIHTSLTFKKLNDGTITAEVTEVLGYGASTPRLSTGTTLELSYQETHSEYLHQLNVGDSFDAAISKSPAGIGTTTERWSIIQILD